MGNILSGFSYTLLLTLVFPIKSFKSHDKNIVSLCEYETVLLNSTFISKIAAAEDATSFRYSNLSQPTVNLTMNGSDLSGR